MKKLFKRLTAVCMAAIMMVTVLCTYAFASGTITGTMYGTGTNLYMEYTFDVDGDKYEQDNNDTHYGQTSTKGFVTSSKKQYQIKFSGSTVGATVRIYNEANNALVCSFSIPKHTPGMPTMTYNANLDAGQYYVKVVSASDKTYSEGGFAIYGISGEYTR